MSSYQDPCWDQSVVQPNRSCAAYVRGLLGFTLIELLVVIVIIAILASLGLAAMWAVKRSANKTITSQRMQEVQSGLQAVGAGSGESLQTLLLSMRRLIGLGAGAQPAAAFPGVAVFRTDLRVGAVTPAPGESWPAPRPTWMLDHPLGYPATDFVADPEGNNPPIRFPRLSETPLPPDPIGISSMTPRFSAELMLLAGVSGADDQTVSAIDRARELYFSDRNPNKPWNDRWGNPLVIGFAWYHPRMNASINNAIERRGAVHSSITNAMEPMFRREDLFLIRAQESYGFYRSIYASVGSVTDVLPTSIYPADLKSASSDWTGAAGLLATLWIEIETACNHENGSELWAPAPSRDLVTQPPWRGVRSISLNRKERMLVAPVEIR